MHYLENIPSTQQSAAPLPNSPPAHQGLDPMGDLELPTITLQMLLRQTGFGIKIRFLLALMCIAIIPAITLVLLLGDPLGSEQQAALSQAMSIELKAQAAALNQALETRQDLLVSLAKHPGLASSELESNNLLHTVQLADKASIAWLLVTSDGVITASGDHADTLVGQSLGKTQIVAHSDTLSQLVHTAAGAGAVQAPVTAFDEKAKRGWIALAVPVLRGSGTNAALVAVWSLADITHDLVTPISAINDSVALLIDGDYRLIANAGTFASDPHPFATVPLNMENIRDGANAATVIAHNPLTGRNDLCMSMPINILHGHYLVLAPQDATLVPSSRVYFSGRNTPLLLLSIIVAVVLVATWVALPIVRPIRRATRSIGNTTQEVRQLATNARNMALEHSLGTEILSGASRRLSGRRQSIVRDSASIGQLCNILMQRLQLLHQWTRPLLQQQAQMKAQTGNEKNVARQSLEAFQQLQQTTEQIYKLARSIATGLENDQSLSQLDQAMESAREIAGQFEGAGKQLELGAQQLESAAGSLL